MKRKRREGQKREAVFEEMCQRGLLVRTRVSVSRKEKHMAKGPQGIRAAPIESRTM